MEKRLTSKELAWEIRRSPAYVSYMRRAGFVMPGNMATLEEALSFIRLYPFFNCTYARTFPARRSVNSVKPDAVRPPLCVAIGDVPKGPTHL